jgi:succinate dehydrogenase / fumarate reductase cytochrome b subunit
MPSAEPGTLISSVLKKQIIAITGLVLVGFISGHLAGNMILYLGHEAFNGYSDKLHSLGELLWIVRAVLIAMVLVHITLATQITFQNWGARDSRYAVSGHKTSGEVILAKRSMIYTGLLIVCFLFLHLIDFTFADHEGPSSLLGGKGLGLYGLVWNSFLEPWRAVLYVATMCLLGLHLSHGIQSLFQSLGINHERWTPRLKKLSNLLGLLIALGFSSIPIYINIVRTPPL